MPETASLEPHEALPPPAARRDVRVVTTEQLLELRREQQEIYQSLRSSGSSPSDAARQIGIPRSLADEWERSAASARGGSPAPASAPTKESVPAPRPATGDLAPEPPPAPPATEAESPVAAAPATPAPATPAPAKTRPRPAEPARVVHLDGDPGDLAREARDCAQRLQRELTALKRLVKRLEAATAAASGPLEPSGPAGSPGPRSTAGTRANASASEGATVARIPSRAARSSLTSVLLARGRARQHPAPPSRT